MKNRIIKSTLSVLLVLSLFLGLLPAVSPVAEAAYGYAGWLPDGVYEISAKLETNYVWDLDTTGVTDTTYYNRSPLIVAPRDGSNTQKWVLRSYGDGTYTFRNLQYNNWLNVDAGEEKLHIYRASSSTTGSSTDMNSNYRFRLHYNPDGTYSFESVKRADANNSAYATMKQGGNTVTASAADATANITHFYITPVNYSYTPSKGVAFKNGGVFYLRFYPENGFGLDAGIPHNGSNSKYDVGAEVRVWEHVDSSDQTFIIEPTSDGHYTIRSQLTGRLLTLSEGYDADASKKNDPYDPAAAIAVTQQSKGAATTVNEKWNVVPVEDGSFVFVSCKTGGALDAWINVPKDNGDPAAKGLANSVRVGTWTLNYGGTQRFIFSNAAATASKGTVFSADTGLYPDSFNLNDTISFPIEIYDYKADGLLFEYAETDAAGPGAIHDANATTTITISTLSHWTKEHYNGNYCWLVPSGQSVKGPNDGWTLVICENNTVKTVDNSGTKYYTVPSNGFALYGFRGGPGGLALASLSAGNIVTHDGTTVTISGRRALMGNNKAFGLLRKSNGGASGNVNIYYNETSGAYREDAPLVTENIGSTYTANTTEKSTDGAFESIALVNTYLTGGVIASVDYQTLVSSAIGYQLFNKMTDGLATVGLLESALGNDGVPVYKEETVTYVAQLLYTVLPIPYQNSDGTLNYNFAKGEARSIYGNVDLPQALRNQLVTQGNSQSAKSSYQLGSYSATLAKASSLRGSWDQVKGNITTCFDAAYFLLNNIFNANGYHVDSSDYDYNVAPYNTLVLTAATTTAGKQGYVFDAGFSTSIVPKLGACSVEYDAAAKTIRNTSAAAKTMYYFSNSATTTYYPFLPITTQNNATGMTTGYSLDPGIVDNGTEYNNRDYNYVLKSTGRFVYEPDKDLFFDFEGDDDVYLFINGQLVLDIGGAHGITKVEMSLNDYVNWAWNLKNDTTEYNKLSEENQARVDALALEAGESYDFDFFYMERHGYGANRRIFTNISLSNKNATTVKHAYQGGELQNNATVNPNALVEYGFSIENTGNEDLTDFTFTDNDLGVTISYYNNGLVIDETVNGGATLVNAAGAKLTAEDLVVTHYLRDGTAKEYTTNSSDGLKNILGADNTNAIVLRTGEKILVRGIYVKDIAQIPQMKSESKLRNTVQTVCYANGQPLTSQADFTVYIPASPMYYQWAAVADSSKPGGYDHGLLLSQDQFVQDVIAATKETDNPLYGQGSGLEKGVQSMTVCTASGANYNNPYLAIDSNNNIQIKYQKTGAYTAFIKLTYNGGKSSIVVPLQIYVFDVPDQSFVLDYGLKARVGDPYAESGQYSITGVSTTHTIEAFQVPGNGKDLSFDKSTTTELTGTNEKKYNAYKNCIKFTADEAVNGEYQATYGTFSTSTAESGSASFTYRPTAFMEGLDSVYTAVRIKSSSYNPETVALGTVDIHNEVELYYKTTIVPASIVYYEDDFPAINYYTQNGKGTTIATIKTDGKGSSELYQSVDNSEQYGHDATYENGGMEMSGNSGHVITISESGVVADFTFKGTGFELIGRTNATDNTVLVVTVYDGSNNVVKRIPVILEYDNNVGGVDDTKDEGIYQVPVVRVEGLTHGSYKVEIKALKPYSDDGVTRTSKLFIDGVRIFRPIFGSNDEDLFYTTEENNAEIVELRSLIVEGTALVSELKKDGITVSGGTSTFTENRNNLNTEGAKYEGNTVTSVNDYLTLGPNNEVYLDGISKKQAVVLYVRPTGKLEDAYLQVGVHAVDDKLRNGVTGPMTPGEFNQSYLENGTKKWMPVSTGIKSATEQYYRIDLSSLSQREDGAYEVVLCAAEGMLSLTSIKYSGLTIESCGGKAATYAYQGGVLVKLEDNGTTTAADPASLPDFASLSVQLRSTQMVEPKPDTEHIFIPGEPDADPEDPVDPVDPVDPADPVDPVDPPEPEAPVFTDVSGQWYEKEVNALAALGIVNGYADGSFGGNRSITRAEFVTMLVRAFDLTAPTGYVSPFTDVNGWSKPYVDAAAACGVVNGVTETTFAPDELITREQMMTMIYRVQQYRKLTIEKAEQIPVLKDLDQVSLWAKIPVNALIETGLILGDENQCLRPQSNCTRAECAVVLYRLLDKSQQKED